MGAGIAPRAGAELPLAPTPEAPEGGCFPTADPDLVSLEDSGGVFGPCSAPGYVLRRA